MAAASRVIFLTAIEKRIEELARALAGGRRPSHAEAETLWRDLGALPRTSEAIPSWKFAELDAAAQEIVRRALPPEPSSAGQQAVAVPTQRPPRPGPGRKSVAPPLDLDARFDALRQRVDALHDVIEAGRRPTWPTLDELQAELEAHRREADCAEVRQMLNDLRGFRRRVIAMSSRTSSSDLASSRVGRGFWGSPLGEGRRPRRGVRPTRRRGSSGTDAPSTGELSARRAQLADESRRLRDRAERIAAAVPRGRTLPVRESERLFLYFKALRPDVDPETRALNDAAVRGLADAVIIVRRRSAKD